MPEDTPNRLDQLEIELSRLRGRLGELERELRACRESAFSLEQDLRTARRQPAAPEPEPEPAAPEGVPVEPSQIPVERAQRPSFGQSTLEAFFKGTATEWSTPPPGAAAPRTAPPAPRGPSAWDTARELLFKVIGRPPEGENIEMLVGIYWTVRVGLLAMAAALGMWAVYVSQFSGPLQRVLLGYALAAALLAGGWYFRRRVELFGRSLVSGGLAIGFFVSFAAHFLAGMHCMSIPPSVLLAAGFLIAMLRIAERWQAPAVAGMSIFLGQAASYVAMREIGAEPLITMLVLAAAALYLQLRHRWVQLSLFALVSSYLTLAPWMLDRPEQEALDFHFWSNLAYLSAIYGVFLCAQLLLLMGKDEGQKRSVALATTEVSLGVQNALFYFAFASILFMMTDRVEQLHWFYFPLAAVQVVVGALESRRGKKTDAFYFALAVVLAMLAIFSKWDGVERNAILYAFALTLLVASYRLDKLAFYVLAQCAVAVAWLDFVHDRVEHPFRPTDYWGGLFGAAVLFTKSTLEERRLPPGHFGAVWAEILTHFNRIFSWAHAALGVICVAYLTQARFDGTVEMRVLAALFTLLLLAALSLRARPAFWAACALLLWSHVQLTFSLPAAWPGADTGPLWGWTPIAAATLLCIFVLTPRTLRHAWASLEGSEPAFWSAAALTGLVFSCTAVVHVIASNGLTIVQSAPLGLAGLLLFALAWEYERMTHERSDHVVSLHHTLARVAAAMGGWIVPIAACTSLTPPHALLAATLGALAAGAAAFRLRPMAYAAGVALLVALGQDYWTLGVFAAARDWPTISLFLLAVGAAVLIAAERALHDRPATWLLLPALAVQFIAYALLYQHLHRAALYPCVALVSVLLLWGGSAVRARSFAAASLLVLALAQAAFYYHGFMHTLPGHAFFNLILPMLCTGLLTACYERIATGAWKLPGLPPLSEEWAVAAKPLRHVLLVSMALLGIATTARSDLLAPQLSAVGWTVTAVLLLVWGFIFREGIYRRYGLGMFLLVIGRILLKDTAQLELKAKIIVYFVLGGCLVGVGALYVQFREKLMKWLG